MKRLLVLLSVFVLCLFSFAGCSQREKTQAPLSKPYKKEDHIYYTDNRGEKCFISETQRDELEKTAALLAQQILTFTDVANTEKSVYPQDFDTADILNICLSGGGFSSIGVGIGEIEYDEYYPYKEMGEMHKDDFAISRENCRIIAKQLFGKDYFYIDDDHATLDLLQGHYWDLRCNRGPEDVDDIRWKDGVLTALVTIRLNRGDRIRYGVEFLPKEEDGKLYLSLKEIHSGDILFYAIAGDYIRNLRPQLEYTVVTRDSYGTDIEDMAFYPNCLYYEDQGEIGELFSFRELVAGTEDSYSYDNYYKTRRNMRYLLENSNLVYAKDAWTPDSTGYENIPQDSILVASTYENTVPVKIRYTNYMQSDRKPKQLWIDYFTQMKNNTKGAKDTPVVIYESYEFVIDGVECALVHCTNFVPVNSYSGLVLDGPPAGSEFIYYNEFHYFIGNKIEKTDKALLSTGVVDTRPLTECTTSFCGDEIIHNDDKLKPQKLYCQFYDSQGNVAVYNIYDMMWTGDCSINMCREYDEEPMVIDIDGDGQLEILEWTYAHSMYYFHSFPIAYNLDTSTLTFVSKEMNIEW